MKRMFFTLLGCLTFTAVIHAQNISTHALGVRFEGGDGLGPEISYQRALGGNNRLELDLGFRDNKVVDIIKLTATYQWVWNLSGNFNWYAGAGGGVGILDYDPDFRDDSSILLSADGILGIEYSFRDQGVPILLSLDFNPTIRLLDDYQDNFGMNAALAIRFQF